jgi:hypothetical protein
MNALANSQMKELEKFLEQSELPSRSRPTFARYTGQESQEERQRSREAKPDILLTNFMMLELLMTRQNALDRAVMDNAHGLDYIVLDELHTYRGRQGADMAMLVRRVRDRLYPAQTPSSADGKPKFFVGGDDGPRVTADELRHSPESSIATPSRAKLFHEEPEAGKLHIRDCEG